MLTFDDGPVPGVTDFVLEQLYIRNMVATFFMVGANIAKYPELAREVAGQGHGIGNHTFNHLDGWKVPFSRYMENVNLCDGIIAEKLSITPRFFRPPYGRLRSSQATALKRNYDIVFWEIISGDYLPNLADDSILRNIEQKTKSGSIVLFHDQEKTRAKVRRLLPNYLDYLRDSGFQTQLLPGWKL